MQVHKNEQKFEKTIDKYLNKYYYIGATGKYTRKSTKQEVCLCGEMQYICVRQNADRCGGVVTAGERIYRGACRMAGVPYAARRFTDGLQFSAENAGGR